MREWEQLFRLREWERETGIEKSRSRRTLSFILFLVEKSLARINCLLAYVYVRTSLIVPKIILIEKCYLA
jgi:hypothetical protein